MGTGNDVGGLGLWGMGCGAGVGVRGRGKCMVEDMGMVRWFSCSPHS